MKSLIKSTSKLDYREWKDLKTKIKGKNNINTDTNCKNRGQLHNTIIMATNPLRQGILHFSVDDYH